MNQPGKTRINEGNPPKPSPVLTKSRPSATRNVGNANRSQTANLGKRGYKTMASIIGKIREHVTNNSNLTQNGTICEVESLVLLGDVADHLTSFRKDLERAGSDDLTLLEKQLLAWLTGHA